MIVPSNWVDWLILAIITLSALISLKRGFVKEVLSLVIWLMAILLSIMFHQQLAVILAPYIDSPSLRKLAALFCLFILCLLVGGLFSFILSQLVHWTGLTGTDRLLGMVFGSLRGVLVVVVVLMLGKTLLPLHQEQWWLSSNLIPHFERLETWVMTHGLALRDIFIPLISGRT